MACLGPAEESKVSSESRCNLRGGQGYGSALRNRNYLSRHFSENPGQEYQPWHRPGSSRGRQTGHLLWTVRRQPGTNGIPAKSFAIVATDDVTLEEGMAKYEPKEVD